MPDPKNPDENQPSDTPEAQPPEGQESAQVTDSGEETEISSADVADSADILTDPVQPDAPENEPLEAPVEIGPGADAAPDPLDEPGAEEPGTGDETPTPPAPEPEPDPP